MNQNKTLIILGTSRSDGHTRKIINEILNRTDADFIDLNDYNIGYYDYEHSNQNDDYFMLSEKMMAYDTLLFASPVYWYSMSAVMKTFFDRFSDLLRIRKETGRKLRGKRMLVVTCSSDQEEYASFFDAFRLSADYLGMNYGGQMHGWIEQGEIPAAVMERIEAFVGNIRESGN